LAGLPDLCSNAKMISRNRTTKIDIATLIVNLVLACILLAACDNDKETRTESKGAVSSVSGGDSAFDYDKNRRNKPKSAVLFVAKTFTSAYFRDMESGVREAFREIASDYDLIVRAGKEEDDVDGQGEILTSFIIRHRVTNTYRLAGVVLAPAGSNTVLIDAIKQLNYAQIPVVILGTRMIRSSLERANAQILTVIGSSDKQDGALAAKIISKRLSGHGTVLLLKGVDRQQSPAGRRQGFLAELKEINARGASYEIVEVTATWRLNEAVSDSSIFNRAGRNIDAIFATNDQMALWAAAAIGKGPDKVPKPAVIIGYGAADEAGKATYSGQLVVTLVQDPKDMGRKAVNALRGYWAHKAVDPRIIVPVKAYPPDEDTDGSTDGAHKQR
jgi:ABC-type sugar transport system substrate-binding protein